MILEIVPKSFELSEYEMFIIGEAKYRFKEGKPQVGIWDSVITLPEKDIDKEFDKAEKVTICFKSPALEAHDSPIGIMNLFYCKVFEPVVEEKEGEKIDGEELPDPGKPIIDEDRVKQCRLLVEDCKQYIGRVYQYEVSDETDV